MVHHGDLCFGGLARLDAQDIGDNGFEQDLMGQDELEIDWAQGDDFFAKIDNKREVTLGRDGISGKWIGPQTTKDHVTEGDLGCWDGGVASLGLIYKSSGMLEVGDGGGRVEWQTVGWQHILYGDDSIGFAVGLGRKRLMMFLGRGERWIFWRVGC